MCSGEGALVLEKALYGSKLYYAWLGFLIMVIIAGLLAYLHQFDQGLGVTGMSRDVSWGLYIAQFTFMVGVAASAVMVAIPYYLHDYKEFSRIVILGEFLAVAAVVVCILFIFVDLGQPARIFNMILHPSPNSIMFWDMVALSGYLLINLVIGWTVLGDERKGSVPAAWLRVLAIISIPWAISIHTVTAFIYAGLAGRAYWLSAIMAARFLASAFAAGPALLIILCLFLRKHTSFKTSVPAIQSLAQIVCYAMIANLFFFLLEIFTAFYSNIPGHMATFRVLFTGMDGFNNLVPFMWGFVILAVIGITMLLIPPLRRNEKYLTLALAAVFVAAWLDKGVALVLGGFAPNAFGRVTGYIPSLTEITVILGVYAVGALLLTILYKVVIDVRVQSTAYEH
jgi:molybdopterin-containing oxidoreductase family membrane subunit